LGCLMAEIPAFQTTPEARGSDLAIRPLPTSLDELPIGVLRFLEEEFPESTDHIGYVTGNLGSLIFVDEQLQEAGEELGWSAVHRSQYNTLGEASWTPLAETLSSADVRGLVYTGEPENLAKLLQAMDDIGFEPDWTLGS